MICKRLLFLCCICPLCWAAASAQTVQLDAGFDSTYILIGDQINFTVRVEQTGPVSVTFPEWKDTLIKSIEILKVMPSDTSFTATGSLVVSQDLLVTSFDSGLYFVPPILFPVYSQGIYDTLRSPVAGLQVFSLPLDTAQAIFDIKPIYKIPLTFKEILIIIGWVLAGIAAVGLLVLFYLAVVKKKKPLALFRSRIVEPPHVIALRDLEHLRHEKLWQSGQTKAYYTRLTEIVRTYISGRYGINAMESTSDDILAQLKQCGLTDNDLYTKLEGLLSCADLVKFAKMSPLPTENDTFLLDAVIFVNHTKIRELIPSDSTS